ncbi:MAG: hypothetical protein HQM02_13245, partial [Magnetococcales bacterium]|nr:hypothetical protein [Magnetococcales bacterium]
PLHLPLRFFGTAPLFILLTGCGMAFWGQEIWIAPLLPVTVGVLHLTVLGWLLMVVMGAMYQMIPVLAGIPVPWPGGIPWVHGLFTLGVAGFVAGVGLEWWPAWTVPFSLVALGLSVAGFLVPVALALVKAPARHPTVNAMRVALFALTGTLLLGLIFLWEYAFGFWELDRHAVVGIHLVWGLLGVMGSLIVGVSFQVLPMFYMTPEFPPNRAGWILRGMALFLSLMPAALLWAGPEHPWALYAAALPGVVAVAWYGVETRRMLVNRKRKLVDATLRFWYLGFGCGFLALLSLALWPVAGDERLRYLFGLLYVLGWVASVMTGMLHKIIPFLVWFHRFSNLAGLQEIPMMDDLSPLRAVNAQVYLHGGLVLTFALAILTGWDWAVRLGGIGLLGVGGISLYALWFALRIQPPPMPEMPDFASFFKDVNLPQA